MPEHAVVRAMPNTPALVRQGAAAIAPGRHATDAHLELAERVLGAVGIVVRVPEKLLDAVTGLSGSGPAYVFLVAETLIEAGVLVGLPRDIATVLVHQTLVGSAALLGDGTESSRGVARRGHLARRYDRGRSADARGARRARRVPVPRSRPRPTGRVSSAGPGD